MTVQEKCDKAVQFAADNNINLYEIAFADGNEIKMARCVKANALNDSYSVTKLFVTTAVGILCDRNIISLDDSLISVLKNHINYDYDEIWNRVTFRHALSHSMGINADTVDVDVDDIKVYGGNTLKYALDRPPVFEPGSTRIYTDTAHYLLARAVTKLTGIPCEDFIQKEILNPLHFGTVAWERDTEGYLIGSSGGYMRAEDMIKLAMLYRNYGVWEERQIISKSWCDTVMNEQFDLYPTGMADWWGKGGMNGQMTMFSRENNSACAWHSFVDTGDGIDKLQRFVCSL